VYRSVLQHSFILISIDGPAACLRPPDLDQSIVPWYLNVTSASLDHQIQSGNTSQYYRALEVQIFQNVKCARTELCIPYNNARYITCKLQQATQPKPFPAIRGCSLPATPADWDISRSRLSQSRCQDRFPSSQSLSKPEGLPIAREGGLTPSLHLHRCRETLALEAPSDMESLVHCTPRSVEGESYAFRSAEDRTIHRACDRVCGECPWKSCPGMCRRATHRKVHVLGHPSMSSLTQSCEELLSGT
jgi:hypothetical protein